MNQRLLDVGHITGPAPYSAGNREPSPASATSDLLAFPPKNSRAAEVPSSADRDYPLAHFRRCLHVLGSTTFVYPDRTPIRKPAPAHGKLARTNRSSKSVFAVAPYEAGEDGVLRVVLPARCQRGSLDERLAVETTGHRSARVRGTMRGRRSAQATQTKAAHGFGRAWVDT